MARTAAADERSQARTCARAFRRRLAAVLCLAAGLLVVAAHAQAQPIKGEAAFSAAGGYARLVLKLDEDVDSDVSVAGAIVVIRFKRPVDINVDKLSDAVPGYVGSARRDPDGAAIRLSLARRVTVNAMTAGERIFVDLLPDSWSGLPPSLPQEVIRELSERARIAERALRAQRAAELALKRAPVRVRASVQPTFVRFVFELPDGASVSSALNEQKLALVFNTALTFDLADARLAAPSNVASINQKIEGENASVEVALIGDVDVHSFREDKNYIVDIGFQSEKPSPLASPAAAAPAPAAAKPAASDKPADEAPPQRSGGIAPPPSEMIARQVKPGKPEPAINPQPAPPVASAPAPAIAKEAPARAAVAPPPKIVLASAEPSMDVKPDTGDKVEARRNSDGLRLTFSFASAAPAALFRRADMAWLIFDSAKPVDLEPIRREAGSVIGDVSVLPLQQGQAIRMRLNRPQLASLTGDEKTGQNWTVTFADTMQTPSQPLTAIRNITDPARANVTVPIARPGLMHRLVDPDAGDALMVITAAPPGRGFVRRQDFVEFSLLESTHGVVIQPNSDDVIAEIASDKITLSRPGGLTLSSADVGAERTATAVRPIFDVNEWRRNQSDDFIKRLDVLVTASANASAEQRTPARLDLARFYMSRGMYPEAKGVLDLALGEAKPGQEDLSALIVHSAASTLMGRPEQGLKDIASPAIGTNYDSQLWKALALARQGKWADAREKFKSVEFAVTSLPLELQRAVISEAMRASIEVKDYSGAGSRSNDLDVIGIPPDLKPQIAVLRGRLAEALGREKDALTQYKAAAGSANRAAAMEAKLLDIALRQKREEITQGDALRQLETSSVTWRGDGLEVKALSMMARIYSDTGRYGEALAAARTATRLQPNSDISRAAQDEAAALFAQLFLGPKGDDLPPVDALAMFYEHSELTPIGRRGDEMIRRLADRLVAVDLLDQAADLLQYQVDHRLEGAARAQVAARLAMVYLMNRKPDRAIAALRTTRIADLAGELRQQRLLLEARAQSDVGRRDLGLDIISNISGREAIRLRSDIYWAARRWRESSEQIELYYGDRWRDFKPLNPVEKGDVMRAVVGYALAEDSIGLARFREKYAALMSGEADRAAFDTASRPASTNSAEFAQIAKMAASVDTLDGFLREMKARFPDMTAKAPLPPETQRPDPFPTGALPAIVGLKRVEAAR
ncbi:tetratricopeptide repeat protein [Bradyrhizobium sp.]|jgi:tetratricopeptide (TPR) repeat protein|uniref:tetratricopeptide repeat protein n=1 Tax=Bradyrhizobium sp. TaxID=376 RepID=UPI002E011CE1|nr:tetratricopeptide repeat protein [Bradyrhizobium sp.]